VSDLVAEVEDLLEGRHRAGVHRLAADTGAGDVAGVLGAAGWQVLTVDVDAATDKASLLAGFAAAGRFPAWVGGNWDALQDALRDLSWMPGAGYAVLLDGWDGYAVARPGDAEVLRGVLLSAAAWWEDAGTPFHVLLWP
jgi:hypothetical protein